MEYDYGSDASDDYELEEDAGDEAGMDTAEDSEEGDFGYDAGAEMAITSKKVRGLFWAPRRGRMEGARVACVRRGVARCSLPTRDLLFLLQNPYKVLSRPELSLRQKEAVAEVTGVLGIGDEEAQRVLRKFKW